MKVFSQIAVTVLLCSSLNAFAQEGDFATRKAEVLKVADERIAAMQTHKTCVSAAADHEALKKCMESMRDAHKEMKHDVMEKRRDRLDKKIKKMEEKKSE